jgi:hypothetical protein
MQLAKVSRLWKEGLGSFARRGKIASSTRFADLNSVSGGGRVNTPDLLEPSGSLADHGAESALS